MHVIAFLLVCAGAAAALVCSGTGAQIAAGGAGAWLKNLGALDAKTLCVLASVAAALVGALFALCRKRFGSLLLLAAAAVVMYGDLKLGAGFPYGRVAAGLFAAGAVCCWMRRRADDGADDAPAVLKEEAAVGAAEPEIEAAAVPEPAAEAVAEPEVESVAEAAEPVAEAVEPEAPVEAAPADEVVLAEKKPARYCVWALLAGLAAAAFALVTSGVGAAVASHGANVCWLADFAAFDLKTKVVLAVAALAAAGGVFGFFRCSLGGLLLAAAAGVCACAGKCAPDLFPNLWGAVALCAAAAVVAWVGSAAGREPGRYTVSYVYAAVFALLAAAFALKMSGVCAVLAANEWNLAAAFAALDLKGQAVAAVAAAAVAGAALALVGLRVSVWLMLGAMLGSLAAEMAWTPLYNDSWVTILLLALASLLSGALVSASVKRTAPVKRLTLHGAFIMAVFAALAGAALMMFYEQGALKEKFREARANDPAYEQMNDELKARDAEISAMIGKVAEQVGIVAERDKQIVDLTAQSAEKDAQIAALTEQNAASGAQAQELNAQLMAAKAQLAEAQAAAGRTFLYMRGSANVRTMPGTAKNSKVIGHLVDTFAEVLDTQRPEGSSANWHQIKFKGQTGWVFGKNATLLDLDK